MSPEGRTADLSMPSTPQTASAEVPTTKSRRGRAILVSVIVLAVAGGLIAWRTLSAGGTPDNVITVSGRIESDDSAVAPKLSGRILEVRVREGDTVNAGDVIAVLDDQQVRAREDQAHAVLMSADARGKAARDQISVLRERLHAAQLQTEWSRADSSSRVLQAQADLAGAEAQLAQQQASYQLALFDKDAYARLAESGAVSERQGKQAASAADQQAAAVAAAQKRVDAAQGALETAKANLATPEIRAADSLAVRRQIAQQDAEVASAEAQIDQARAQLQEAQANRQDLTVRAPFAGTVVTRAAEPGEVVLTGTALVTLVDLGNVYLRGFVPEGRIGLVKVGQPARAYLDSNPKQPLDATVTRIDPQATFTPENTYFRDDRVKQVVGVKLTLKAASGFAKPGMPADGEILVSGTAWPDTGRR